MKPWWEKEPLRFECQADCFRCCQKPGLVYFDAEDIRAVAKVLHTRPSEFKAAWLTRDHGYWVLEVEEGRPCPFLDEKGCSIHEVKPKQCRTYPFWRENLDSRNTWNLAGGFCPGIDQGPRVPPQTIRENLKKFRL